MIREINLFIRKRLVSQVTGAFNMVEPIWLMSFLNIDKKDFVFITQ